MKNKVKTIIFNFIMFSALLTPIIHAAADFGRPTRRKQDKRLLKAADKGDLKRVKELIKGGVDSNTADDGGNTALMIVINADLGEERELIVRGEIVKYLLRHGAKPNLRDSEGNTALAVAGRGPNVGLINIDNPIYVKLLLKHKANANSRDMDGMTALMNASYKGNDRIVKALLPFSNFRLRNHDGRTALDVARNDDIAKLIRKEKERGAEEKGKERKATRERGRRK